MNIPPKLEITLVFSSMKKGHDLKITKFLNKYSLRLEGFRHYTENGLYFFRYVPEGEPDGLIKFLGDKNIVSKLI